MKRKLKLLFARIKFEIKILWLQIYSKTPWYSALVLSAWWKYKESNLFRQRWINFNETEAAKMYLLKEHRYFIYKVKQDKELMKRIRWNPLSVINEKADEKDDELRQFVVLK